MNKPYRRETASKLVGPALVLAFAMTILSPISAIAAQGIDTIDISTPLLVVSFLLSVCILAVSGFTLWQSHRYYLDASRLSREITATVTELHQKVLELIYSLKDFLAHESELARMGELRASGSRPRSAPGKVDKIAESISDTETKIKALERTLNRLNEQLSLDFRSDNVTIKLSALSDVEYAVLTKLSQDPRFFEEHSFTSFGATPRVLDSLLSRQLIVFNKDGKAEVPREVAVALKHFAPEN